MTYRLAGGAVVLAIGIVLGALLQKNYSIWPIKHDFVWSIGMYEGRSQLALASVASIHSPVFTRKDVSDVKAEFVADPFLLRPKSYLLPFLRSHNP
jgi:hypothetical protein